MTDNVINPRRIDKDLPIPYYYQIVQVLKESIMDIEDANREEEIALPTEAELGDLFSVNRGTIRHALQVLEREGLIYRKKGRGTFVHRRRVEVDLSTLSSTTEDMKTRGWEPSTEMLEIKKVHPRSHISNLLNIQEEEYAWEIFRRRFANGEPISLQRAFFPYSLFPDIDQKDLVKRSLFDIWEKDYNLHAFRAEQTIRTRTATDIEAELLEMGGCDPLFEITRITFDIHGTPFEYLISVWRGDRYDFFVRLSTH